MSNRKPNCSCSICGKEIYRRPSQLNTNVFCSKECVGKSQRVNEKDCPVCGKRYIGHKKTCSRSCSNKNRTGIKYDGKNLNNKFLSNSKVKYTLSSKRGGKCEECGNLNYNILQVHHIIEKSKGGSDEENNLQILCPNYHYTKHYGYELFESYLLN